MITPTYVGKAHDFSIFKNENLIGLLPSKKPIYTDTGFLGIENLREDILIRKPKKKPKKRNLNGGEMLGNSIISRERVKVEHAIGGFKRFKLASGVYRGITRSLDNIYKLACGLWNLKLAIQAKLPL